MNTLKRYGVFLGLTLALAISTQAYAKPMTQQQADQRLARINNDLWAGISRISGWNLSGRPDSSRTGLPLRKISQLHSVVNGVNGVGKALAQKQTLRAYYRASNESRNLFRQNMELFVTSSLSSLSQLQFVPDRVTHDDFTNDMFRTEPRLSALFGDVSTKKAGLAGIDQFIRDTGLGRLDIRVTDDDHNRLSQLHLDPVWYRLLPPTNL